MKFNKYNIAKKGTTTTLTSSGGASSGGYGNNLDHSAGGSIQRTLWGNDDRGTNDIDETITVQGNIYCVGYAETDESTDSDVEQTAPDYSDIFGEDEDCGNLSVEKKALIAGEIESPEIYASKALYVPNPETKAKTDIIELLKGYDSRITNNSTEIEGLKSRVSTAETNITNINQQLTEIVSEGVTESRVLELMQQYLQNGSATNPIVLLSGVIELTDNYGTYKFNGSKNANITLGSITTDNGLMNFDLLAVAGKGLIVNSVIVNQNLSGATYTAFSESNTSFYESNWGFHFFESRYYNGKIYIREFHRNGDNNVASYGWAKNLTQVMTKGNNSENKQIYKVNIIVTGYII